MDCNYQNHNVSYQHFLSQVFKWLFIGLTLTTMTSVLVSLIIVPVSENMFIGLAIITSLVEIVMVLILIKKIKDLSVESSKKYFYSYSIINGITISILSSIAAPGVSILSFALTGAFFGLLYVMTKYSTYDFSRIGTVCMSALPILMVGYFILLFFQMSMYYYLIVFINLFIFIGITLYDMQRIKVIFEEKTREEISSVALLCALILYLDFINIFIDIVLLLADSN